MMESTVSFDRDLLRSAAGRVRIGIVALLVAAVLGCESGDEADRAEPGSTVSGRILAFEGEGGGGVRVAVLGAGSSTVTAPDGSFFLFNVMPGTREVRFSAAPGSALLRLNVPADSVVELSNIRIVDGAVFPGAVRIEPAGP